LTNVLQSFLVKNFKIRTEQPLSLGEFDEPEPDLSIVENKNYSKEHPVTSELVIEVSQASLKLDRKKSEIYAKANISQYIIINLMDNQLESYTKPVNNNYEIIEIKKPSEEILIQCLQKSISIQSFWVD
jgi:Uma2 family endonuclease